MKKKSNVKLETSVKKTQKPKLTISKNSVIQQKVTGNITKSTIFAIPPDPKKLYKNLRALDYDNLTAIADIIDNSIDAQSKNIRFYTGVKNGDINSLILADDGIGMNIQTLVNGFKLGSTNKTDANYNVVSSSSDLGKFGMGLKTASTSFCTKITVITKKENHLMHTGVYSEENIEQYGEFVLNVSRSSKQDKDFFATYTKGAETGTVILFEKLDRFNFKRKTSLEKNMRYEFSRIYRHFLVDKTFNIFIDDSAVMPQDTLMEKTPEELGQSEIISDKNYTFNIENNKVKVRIKIAFLPDLSNKKVRNILKDEYGLPMMNQETQGFSIIRNKREIKFGEQIDKSVFYKDHWFDRFRAEIHFDPTSDGLFSLNFSKTNISNLNEDLKKAIVDAVYPHFRSIFNRTKKEKDDKKEAKSHAATEKFLSSKKDLLDLPEMKKENTPKVDKPENDKSDKPEKKEKDDSKLELAPRKKKGCFEGTFNEVQLGENAPFYIPSKDPVSYKLKIDINMDHPFYDRYIENTHTMETVDYMIFMMANAEYALPDESVAIAKEMREKVSENLGILLKTVI